MHGRVYFLFGGPILTREVRRATRGLLPSLLRYAFIALLCVEIVMLEEERTRFESYRAEGLWARRALPEGYLIPRFAPTLPADLFEFHRQDAIAAVTDSGRYVSFLLHQLLVVLLVLTPAFTAGAIVHERERDTLQALFGTELRSREIVVGKVLGRLIALGVSVAAVLPPLAFATVLSDIPVWRVVLALVEAALLAYALASACLLVSLWTRRPTDAVIGCYATMVVTFLLGQVAWSSVTAPGVLALIDTLNPLAALGHLLDAAGAFQPLTVLCHLAFWAAAGTLCLAATAACVRPVAKRQAEKQAPRWLWALRPPVGNNPVRWREQYVLGLAPIGVLRLVPRWMGRLGVLTFSLILAGDALGHVVGTHVYRLLQDGEFAAVRVLLSRPRLEPLSNALNLMGAFLLILTSATVGLRCGGSIAEEKRRKTWEDLILTPMTLGEILRGKYEGVMRAAVLPVAVYSLPMFALSALGGWEAVCHAGAWVAGTGLFATLAGAFGIAFAGDAEQRPASNPTADPVLNSRGAVIR